MILTVRVLDDAGAIAYHDDFPIDGMTLIVASEAREPMAREKGATWTAGAVPAFGCELAAATRQGVDRDKIHKLTIQMAMAAWVLDSVFGGLSAEDFLQTDSLFTVAANGVVRHDRLPVP